MSSWGGDRLLDKYLADKGIDVVEPEPMYLVPLPEGAGVCQGADALLTKGEDMWLLELHLPPRNMLKVLAFISQLEAEPEEDGDGHLCGVEQAVEGTFWAWVERPGEITMDSVPKGMRLVERANTSTVVWLLVGPFPTEEGAQDWLDFRNGVTRMKGP